MASAEPIPITVIGGYLGAGKTTLVNELLVRSVGRRLGVVVNDFGELGIDVSLLQSAVGQTDETSVPIVNMANGCVCCTLGDDLRATLLALAAVEPRLDHIVIEASGVADPANAAAWGTVPGFAAGGTVVLAAADSVRRNARDRYVGTEVRRQLVGADLLVVTMTDVCQPSEVTEVVEWLATQSEAPQVLVSHGRIATDVVLGASASVESVRVGDAHLLERGVYVTWSTPTEVTDDGRLNDFLSQLPEGLLRMKGFVDVRRGSDAVTTRLVHVVGRGVSVEDTVLDGPRVLEAIGVAGVLDETRLDALADGYLRGR